MGRKGRDFFAVFFSVWSEWRERRKERKEGEKFWNVGRLDPHSIRVGSTLMISQKWTLDKLERKYHILWLFFTILKHNLWNLFNRCCYTVWMFSLFTQKLWSFTTMDESTGWGGGNLNHPVVSIATYGIGILHKTDETKCNNILRCEHHIAKISLEANYQIPLLRRGLYSPP